MFLCLIYWFLAVILSWLSYRVVGLILVCVCSVQLRIDSLAAVAAGLLLHFLVFLFILLYFDCGLPVFQWFMAARGLHWRSSPHNQGLSWGLSCVQVHSVYIQKLHFCCSLSIQVDHILNPVQVYFLPGLPAAGTISHSHIYPSGVMVLVWTEPSLKYDKTSLNSN